MRIMIIAAAVLAASTLYAQDEPARKAATEIEARVPLERARKGAPYSAETIIEGNQQLVDGNRISRRTTGRVYRDAEGRTRREEDRPNGTTSISITDPVAGFSYSLDGGSKIAWRTAMGVGGAIMGKLEEAQNVRRIYEERIGDSGNREVGFRSTPLSDEDKQKVEAALTAKVARATGSTDSQSKSAAVDQEKAAAAGGGVRGGGGGGRGGAIMRRGPDTPLEHKVLDGIAVQGRSTRTVIPAGQVGNEQPLTILDEQWSSTDLNVLVMTRHVDPRTGESSYRLTNITRAEPDASLFMVPADYTVRDTGIRKMLEASQRK